MNRPSDETLIRRTEEALGLRCAYCRGPAEGNYSIHRDDFGEGPEVDLCDGCGGEEEPSCPDIWNRISLTTGCAGKGHRWSSTGICGRCGLGTPPW